VGDVESRTTTTGGGLVFRRGTTGAFATTLTIGVPINGNWVSFFAAGQFGKPSVSLGDVQITARHGNSQQTIGATPCTVRIRKNANNLTPGERDRFIAAFAQLNNQGLGRFTDFRDMHTNVSSPQAHGAPGFLPWHRAYLLDLERELQAIDPSVALHYWRFDRPSPNIFRRDFLGESDNVGTVFFSPTNPLQFWVTDGVPGINRRPFFNTNNATGVRTEAQTLALGTAFPAFRTMEGNPHGSAHTSFGGSISSINTAAKDPLFFLLHCNVDRLWAKWQQINNRFNSTVAAAYDSGALPIGHNLPDTMWPWNGITTPPRPPTAPGGTLAPSPVVSAPGLSPRVRDSLDFQGKVSAAACMGFDYDDVPFS
jgi:tyrosinase